MANERYSLANQTENYFTTASKKLHVEIPVTVNTLSIRETIDVSSPTLCGVVIILTGNSSHATPKTPIVSKIVSNIDLTKIQGFPTPNLRDKLIAYVLYTTETGAEFTHLIDALKACIGNLSNYPSSLPECPLPSTQRVREINGDIIIGRA